MSRKAHNVSSLVDRLRGAAGPLAAPWLGPSELQFDSVAAAHWHAGWYRRSISVRVTEPVVRCQWSHWQQSESPSRWYGASGRTGSSTESWTVPCAAPLACPPPGRESESMAEPRKPSSCGRPNRDSQKISSTCATSSRCCSSVEQVLLQPRRWVHWTIVHINESECAPAQPAKGPLAFGLWPAGPAPAAPRDPAAVTARVDGRKMISSTSAKLRYRGPGGGLEQFLTQISRCCRGPGWRPRT